MKENDVIGCGFKRGEDQPGKSSVYFTYNGDRIAEELQGVQAGLWPVVHIQKKVWFPEQASCFLFVSLKPSKVGKWCAMNRPVQNPLHCFCMVKSFEYLEFSVIK